MSLRVVALLAALFAAMIGLTPCAEAQAPPILTIAYSSGTVGKFEPCPV